MPARQSESQLISITPTRAGKERWLQTVTPYLLVLPGFIFIAAFTIYPIFSVAVRSLMKQNLAQPDPSWTGWANFRNILSDPIFQKVLLNTLTYVAMVVPLSIVLGLVIATLVNQSTWIGTFLRTMFFYPIVLPLVSVASIWLFMLTPEYGLLSKLTQLLGLEELAMLRSPDTALWALAMVGVWRQSGFYAIFILAGLQGIDREVENAARLDGAGIARLTFDIRLPLLWPTLVFVVTLAISNALQTLDLVYVITQGGPSNATNLMLFHIYETQFAYSNTGAASALSVIFLVMIGTVSAIQIFVVDKLRGGTRV
jgi:sn-glycerol 3-phosphate transport system permease protein